MMALEFSHLFRQLISVLQNSPAVAGSSYAQGYGGQAGPEIEPN